MKTQVIHLDVHDDLISIRDRMVWAKTPRILLVWPVRGQVGVRPLDLTLLRRHAEARGAELGLVTRNREIRSAARELHISIFSTTVEAQKKQWLERRPPRISRRFPRQDMRSVRSQLPSEELFPFVKDPLSRVIVFTVGVLAVLAVMLIFIPSAEIQVAAPVQQQSLTIAVSSVPDNHTVQISGLVPQHTMTLLVEDVGTALPTGRTSVPDSPASGEVVLMNLTEKLISVPSGTVLLAPSQPDVSYLTGRQIDIPAGMGKTARVSVRAMSAGSAGNAIPGVITTLEGPLSASLAVTNPEPVTGGKETLAALASQPDRDGLKKRLLDGLTRQARERFAAQAGPGDVLLLPTLAQTRIVSESSLPPVGQPGDKLSLTLRVEYSIAYASAADLQLLARQVLDASLPPGYSALGGNIELALLSQPVEDQDVQHWQMRAQRSMLATIDQGQLIALVLGKTSARASDVLSSYYKLDRSPNISIRPAWWPWLPFLPIRIAVSG